LEFVIWNLRFICNLVLGICDFRHKTPRQSRRTLTWPKGPDFSGQNKKTSRLSTGRRFPMIVLDPVTALFPIRS
jgi:hypothetical protein